MALILSDFSKSTPGTIHIELRHVQVRIEDSADADSSAKSFRS
jgi:hypothetical protein